MAKDKIEKQKKEKGNSLLGRVGKDISDWGKNIIETLKYKPDSEKIVQLKCKTSEEKMAILSDPQFLNENNFRLQIGKMQKDGGTLYNEITLGLGIEYMINHTKKGQHSIIQIWSDVGENLQKGAEDGVLSAIEEKENLEKFIKNNFGKKGEIIKIEIGSEKYPEVFEAISKGKKGIIPDKEPDLESMIPFNSPLQIIEYLAYHASKDEDLMKLFHDTKPNKYLAEDSKLGKKPGESDADFYGIVEVGLRLFEVLNGISIQGGLGRQRVYDKIISLIINGKDVIKGKREFDCDYKLFPKNYPALQKLHKMCEEFYPNTKFNQLYIELSRGDKDEDKDGDNSAEKDGIKDIKRKLDEKSKLISKFKNFGYGTLLAATLCGATGYVTSKVIEKKHQQEEETLEQERIKMRDDYSKNRTRKWRGDDGSIGTMVALEQSQSYQEEQASILMAAYDISSLNKISFDNFDNDEMYIENDIVEMYKAAFTVRTNENHNRSRLLGILWESGKLEDLTLEEYNDLFGDLTAEEFMDKYGGEIIDKYHIPYQKPYEHFKKYKNAIENTLKYGNKIDISKYKIKEISTKSELSYFISRDYSQKDKPNGFFRLKIIRVYLDNGKTMDLVVAEKDQYYRMKNKKGGEYTLENGYICMKDLNNKYIQTWGNN